MRRTIARKKGHNKFRAVDAGIRKERLGDRRRLADHDSRRAGEKGDERASSHVVLPKSLRATPCCPSIAHRRTAVWGIGWRTRINLLRSAVAPDEMRCHHIVPDHADHGAGKTGHPPFLGIDE